MHHAVQRKDSCQCRQRERGRTSLADIILEMKLMVKGFPGVKALDANLIVERGEIHRLIGKMARVNLR